MFDFIAPSGSGSAISNVSSPSGSPGIGMSSSGGGDEPAMCISIVSKLFVIDTQGELGSGWEIAQDRNEEKDLARAETI